MNTSGFTSATSGVFSATFPNNKRLGFRTRALDKAGHYEAAADSGPNMKEVLLYQDALSGIVSDNRGLPFARMVLPISDNIPLTVTTKPDGSFFVPLTFVSASQVHTISLSKAGYAPLPPFGNAASYVPVPPIDNSVGHIQTFRPYFSTSDDVIINGRFDLGASGWLTAGNTAFSLNAPNGTVGVFNVRLTGLSSELSQVVNIPVSMTKPTLAFVNQWLFIGLNPNLPVPQFLVKIRDGSLSTTVYAATAAQVPNSEVFRTPLQVSWIDMQPWVGKTVTLTFEVSASLYSTTLAAATIDDISLSSWLTPVPKQVTISNTVSITLTGENFIAPVKLRLNNTPLPDAQWVNDKAITATLPANLPFGRYDVYVTNAGGQENVLLGGLVIGTETFVPALLR